MTSTKPAKYYLAAGERVFTDHSSLADAKRAALLLVTRGAKYVDVYHRTEHGNYLQGVMKPDGWSRV